VNDEDAVPADREADEHFSRKKSSKSVASELCMDVAARTEPALGTSDPTDAS
jgi:hypothetical protein